MKTVYLDHNVLIGIIDRKNEYLSLFHQNDKFRIVASIWNLYEATGSLEIEQALALTRCFDGDNVFWIQEKSFIQSQELMSFIFNNYYSSSKSASKPIRQNISEVLATLGCGSESIILNAIPSKIVKAWHADSKSLAIIKEAKEICPAALMTLQKAKKDNQLTRDMQRKIWKKGTLMKL